MRYETDLNGYVTCIFWGCNSGKCKEYTGEIPLGYDSLEDWEERAVINAYYIDDNGNLVLDAERESNLKILAAQQAVDYTPVVHKELYAQQEILESQYLKATASGTVLELTDAKNMAPTVKIKGVYPGKIRIFAQTKNMLRNDMARKDVSGVTFEKLASGKVNVTGTATEDIEYTLAGSSVNTEPLFALLKDRDYYLYSADFECEFRCFNGKATEQVYLGSGGIINLPENKEVTHVVIKIPKDMTLSCELAPTLYIGSSECEWADSYTRVTTIDLTDYEITDAEEAVLSIGGGLAILQADGNIGVVGPANVKLLNGYNLVYVNQGSSIEIEYCKNVIDVESLEFLQGKTTKSNRFMILDDGSIKAVNGYFSGELNSEAGTIGGWHIEGSSLYCDIVPPADFTQEDCNKIKGYIMGEVTLTSEEKELYDLDKDGKVAATDYAMVQKLVGYNFKKSKPGKLVLDTSDWLFPIKVINSEGVRISWFGPGGAGAVSG